MVIIVPIGSDQRVESSTSTRFPNDLCRVFECSVRALGKGLLDGFDKGEIGNDG